MGKWRVVVVSLGILLVAGWPGTASGSAAPRTFWGVVNHGDAIDADFRNLEEGKVGSLRFLVPWDQVQPTPTRFEWAEIDQVVAGAAASGVELLPFPYGSPAWVEPEPGRPPIHSREDRDAWAVFLIELVRRYGPGGSFWAGHPDPAPIRRWQIWNEPNFNTYWRPRNDPAEYARLLRISARTIRDVDPRGEIVLAGLAPVRDGELPWVYLRRLYREGSAKRYFDTAALSTYAPDLEGIEFQIEKARAVMRRAGDARTRIAITEIGWGSDGRGPLVKGLEGQARMLRRAFTRLESRRRALRLSELHWFALQDAPTDPRFCDFCSHAGLFTEPREPKPSWRAFTEFTGAR